MKHILLLILLAFSIQLNAQTKLPTPKCTVLSGKVEGVESLFDGNTETGWFPGWDGSKYPVKVQFDFGEPTTITKVRLFDGVGKPTLTLTSDNTTILTVDLGLYMAWQEREVSAKVRYLTLSISDIQGDIPIRELEFYGGSDVVIVPPTPPTNFKKLTGDALKLGINGFHWIPNDLIVLPNIRVYQMSQWTLTKEGMMVEPTFQGNGNYDKYYTALKELGVEAVPCINTIPDWMSKDGSLRMCDPKYTGDKPSDYIDLAKYVWQYVARYGSKVYEEDLLKINQNPRWNGDPVNQKKSGLNLLKYVEFENEPDRPWNDPLHKYTPEQMAALMSALWDGHEGRMGQYVGVKSADPNIKLVLPGLAEINIMYLAKMKIWFELNRTDKKFCADVINVHHYSNISNPKWPAYSVNLVNGRGISPEADLLELRLKGLKQFVNTNFPKTTEIWFSEFGYDTILSTNPWICQFPQLYSNHTAEDLQSMWLQRIFLIGLSCGMDKLYLFNGIDENTASSGNLFASSGVMYGELPSIGSSFGKKVSYKALQKLLTDLDGYKFYADRSTKDVKILEFRKGSTKRYFYWSPTANDIKVKFPLVKKSMTATEYPQVYTIKSFQDDTTPSKDVDLKGKK